MVSAGYWLNSSGHDAKWLQARVEEQRCAASTLRGQLAGEIQKYGGDFEKMGELADELETKKANMSSASATIRRRFFRVSARSRVYVPPSTFHGLSRVPPNVFARRRDPRMRWISTIFCSALATFSRTTLPSQHYQNHFQALLVDEFQDTDEVQAEIISLLAEDPDRAGRLASRSDDRRRSEAIHLSVQACTGHSLLSYAAADPGRRWSP